MSATDIIDGRRGEPADRARRAGRDERRQPASWAGVVSLSLGVFAIVMSEFLPASLLPRIAGGLHVSTGAAGQAVSVTAFAAAVTALLISVVLPDVDRRRVMIGLTLLASGSDVIVSLAPSLDALLAARVLLGVALGGFWAMATAMAAQLVPTNQVGRALTVVNAGVSLATVAAVPLGAWLSDMWSWRAVFVLAGGVAVLALVVQAVTLPSAPPSAANGLRALRSALQSGVVRVGLFAILLIFNGHFGGFTYIRPAAHGLSGIHGGGFAALLLVFGVANFIGTGVSGLLADRATRVGVLVFPGVLGIGMLVMLAIGTSIAGLFVAAVIWGFGFGGVPTTVLSWGARTQPERLEQIGGLIVTTCNLGVAAGAITGGLLVDGVSTGTPLLVGGIGSLIGAAALAASTRTRSA